MDIDLHTDIAAPKPLEPIALYRAAEPNLRPDGRYSRTHEDDYRRPRLFLQNETMAIGRLRGSYFYSPDRSVSKRHATITREGTAWVIRDAASKGGTWINGHRIESAELVVGLKIITGRVQWVVCDRLDAVPLTAPTLTEFRCEALNVHLLPKRAAEWIGAAYRPMKALADRMFKMSGYARIIVMGGLSAVVLGVATLAWVAARPQPARLVAVIEPRQAIVKLAPPAVAIIEPSQAIGKPAPEPSSEAKPAPKTRKRRAKPLEPATANPADPSQPLDRTGTALTQIEQHAEFWD